MAAVGVGVGIDYGLYLPSRIREEYPLHDADTMLIGGVITAALRTAAVMIVGILPWYFLSGLKFLADMGLLLGPAAGRDHIAINMITALIVLPLLVWWAKPRFVRRPPLALRPGSASAAGSSPPTLSPDKALQCWPIGVRTTIPSSSGLALTWQPSRESASRESSRPSIWFSWSSIGGIRSRHFASIWT